MNRFAAMWKFAWLIALVVGLVPACGGTPSDSVAGTGDVGSTQERVCSGAGLVSNVANYQASAGTLVTWTATASCALPNPEYRFVYGDSNNNWTQARDWSTQNTYVWDTTLVPDGTYSWQVWVREAGSGTYYDTYRSHPYTVTGVNPCTSVSSSVSPAAPQVAGTSVAITSSSVCGSGTTPEYKVLHMPPGGSWEVLQPYSASATFNWNSTGAAAGTHNFQVWVRGQGSPASYESYTSFSYLIASSAPCSGATLSVSPASPALVGSTVTFTAGLSSCGSPEYRFVYLPPGGSWTEGQAYSSSPTFAWNTTGAVPGSYAVQVWVRQAGSASAYEAYTGFYYSLTTTAPCGAATLSASPGSPSALGTSVALTAGSSTCTSPQYRFVYLSPAGTWVEAQPYGASSTFNWNTASTGSGVYSWQVWVRASGSTASYETYATLPYTVSFTASASATNFAAGLFHSCIIRTGGAVDCWGHNENGQIGNGTTIFTATPVAVSGVTATGIAAGYTHSCAIVGGGAVSCWGGNAQGQLGNGSTTDSTTPVSVSGVSGAVAIAGGAAHTCAALNDGTVRCWGYNSQGQLGNNSPAVNSTTPVTVTGLTGVVGVATGYYHTCALLGGGGVKCWGLNSNGQLGNGTTTKSMTPVVANLKDARSLSGANGYNCAVMFDNTVQCWGGNGVSPDASTPVAISGITTATSVTVGASHACATLSSGAVSCWGNNPYSELGDGTTTNATNPVSVVGLTGATAVALAAGNHHTCALFSDNTANCWGYGQQGVLGNSANLNSATPVLVSLP